MHKINTINDTIHFRARSLKGTDVCKSHAYGIPTSSQICWTWFQSSNQVINITHNIPEYNICMYICMDVDQYASVLHRTIAYVSGVSLWISLRISDYQLTWYELLIIIQSNAHNWSSIHIVNMVIILSTLLYPTIRLFKSIKL